MNRLTRPIVVGCAMISCASLLAGSANGSQKYVAVDLYPLEESTGPYYVPQQASAGIVVGGGFFNGLHAVLWSGPEGKRLDLSPGAGDSTAYGVKNGQQVGVSSGHGTLSGHATLWTGTADSAVDLNPVGFRESEALATNGTLQVGDAVLNDATPAGYGEHAMLWNGSASSTVDLHLFIPGNDFIASRAYSIDANGHIFGLAWTDGFLSVDAIEWIPVVPEPGFAAIALISGLLIRRRRRI